jgi:hypothetical protein
MARNKRSRIRLSAGELAAVDAAAAAAGITRAAWLRDQVLRAARCGPNPPAPLPAPPPQHPPAKLTRAVGTYFTAEQFEALDEHARACELTVSAFIRRVVLGFRPMARRPLARSAIVAVDHATKQLNQLVQLDKSGTLLAPEILPAVTELRDEIHLLRDALLTADAAASRKPAR